VGIGSDSYPETMWVSTVVCGLQGLYLVINAVLEQSSGLIFTCQYAELASSLEYHTFPAKVSRHLSTRGNGNTSLMVRAFKALELLCEFEDVFAKSEFDLGKFNTIQHGIDTGTNRPVKQRIRRTPLGFAGEEEAQLKNMLSAGVIRPSVSEWACELKQPVFSNKGRFGAVFRFDFHLPIC
jgi:hypothetical protein